MGMNADRSICLVSFFLLSACVGLSPHRDSAGVTDAEISVYKAGLHKGCVDQGRRQGEDPAKNIAFCDCVLNAFNASLSHEQWQQAVFAAQHRDEAAEARAMFGNGSRPMCRKDAAP